MGALMDGGEQVSSPDVTVVVLLADPDAPTEIARRAARLLPTRLAGRSAEERQFDVTVISEPFSSGTEDPPTLMQRILDRLPEGKADVVVALTELPLHSHGRKLVVDLSHERGLALLSLPALGGVRLRARTQRAVEEVVLGLVDPPAQGTEDGKENHPLVRRFASRLAPIRLGPVDPEETTDLRYVVTGPRGHLRVLAGMVRANRPWRLVPGLSRSFAAALATGAIATVNSTVWNLSETLDTWRLVVATVGSIALMTGWLIVDAHLWHPSAGASPEATQKARLYNASTVITLMIGVLACYLGLFVINLVWALFILSDRVWAAMTQTPLNTTAYVTLSWFVASVATVGGALGSSLEGDDAIRAAAYSKREQERRRMLQGDHGEESSHHRQRG
jgi:hypothetical protein